MKGKEDLGHEPIRKLIVKLGVPATIGMMVNALYNLVDTIFVGKGAGIEALGAMAVCFPVQMTLMAVAMMFGMGGSSVISRALGAKEYNRVHNTVVISAISMLSISLMITLTGFMFMEGLLRAFGASESLMPLSISYMRIILIGNIYYGLVMVFSNFFRAEGATKTAMTVMVIGMLANIILDPIFIFDWGLGMGVAGAALATIIGQLLSFIYIIWYSFTKDTIVRQNYLKFKFKYSLFKEIVTIGLPSFVRNFAGAFITILVLGRLGKYGGDMSISIYGTINKVIMFIFMPAFGVIQGLQPIIGFNYGAKKYARALEASKLGIYFITTYFTVATIAIQVMPEGILSLFIGETLEGADEFIREGSKNMRLMLSAVPFIAIQIVASTLYQAIGKSKEAFILSLSRQIIFLVPLLFILPELMKGMFGLNPVIGVWMVYPVSDMMSVVLSTIMYRKEVKELKRLEETVLESSIT